MLTLLLGLNRDDRRKHLFDGIRQSCKAGRNRMYLLVPEPSTFVMSREICRCIGNDLSNGHIEVIGFKNLVDRVFKDCGHQQPHLDDGGRLLAMATAVNQVKKELVLYQSSVEKTEFLEDLLKTYSNMRLHDISSEMLLETVPMLKTTVLHDKISDLSKIFCAYDAVCNNGSMDPAATLSDITDILRKTTWLSETTWFIDGFTDFPKQQMNLIELIIAQAKNVTVSLSAAGTDDPAISSNISVNTANHILLSAKRAGTKVAIIRTKDISDEHPALARLQNEICAATVVQPLSDADSDIAKRMIHVFADPSPYTECQHIVGTIMRTVRTERPEGKRKYRYRDISVVLCDYDRYAPIMKAVCNRYHIPAYFSSDKEEVGHKPVMQAVFSALLAATRGMPKIDVLQYLKSGMSNLTMEEIDILENYVLTWNIHGRGWQPENGWTMHPDGYGIDLDDSAAETLKEINNIREKGIPPLLTLQQKLNEAKNVGDYVIALYDFLEEIHFSDHLQEIVDNLLEENQNQTAMEYGQISEILSNAMEQMYATIGNIERSKNEFVKLFKVLCSAYKIATIPSCLDQVQIFSLEDARYTCSKFRYIVGAEEGKFPYYGSPVALLSNQEIMELRDNGLELPGSIDDQVYRNMSDIYTVVSGAKKGLVLSYVNQAAPSHLILRTLKLFPTIEVTSGASKIHGGIYEADTISPEMLGRLVGRIFGNTKEAEKYDSIVFQICSLNNKTVQTAAQRVMAKASWTLRDLSKSTVKDLYGRKIPLSATRADTYAACRFHYFLQYGLKLKDHTSGTLTSPVFGRFAHAVLEKVMKEVEARGGFCNVDQESLVKLAETYIQKYTDEKMKGLDSQPERYQYLYKRNCREVISVLRNICEEFQSSDFHSSAYELRVGGEDAQIPEIIIPGKDLSGSFTGITDRVDTCTIQNGRTFFRVVDYKTGKSKVFEMSDILLGKSLQLILYQAALIQSGYVNHAETAGVLYVPAKETIVATQTKLTPDKVEAEQDKAKQRRGILLNDKEALSAMEHVDGSQTRFLPVKYNKDGSVSGDLASAEQLQLLDAFAISKLSDMVNDIAQGTISANPISHGHDRNSCKWCPYKAVCHKDLCGIKYQYTAKVSADEFWKKVSEKVKNTKE